MKPHPQSHAITIPVQHPDKEGGLQPVSIKADTYRMLKQRADQQGLTVEQVVVLILKGFAQDIRIGKCTPEEFTDK